MAKDVLPGGLADNKPDSDFDPKALKDGVKVELEHTDNPQIAKEVSKDHLEEFPEYYSALKVMEQKLKDKTFKKSSLLKSESKTPYPGPIKDKEFKRKDKAVEAAGNRHDRNPTPENHKALHQAIAEREDHIQKNPKLKEHLNKLNTHLNETYGGNRELRKSSLVKGAKLRDFRAAQNLAVYHLSPFTEHGESMAGINRAKKELKKLFNSSPKKDVVLDTNMAHDFLNPVSHGRKINLKYADNPIVIGKLKDGHHLLLDGNHRLIHAKQNNISTIKATVLELPDNFSDLVGMSSGVGKIPKKTFKKSSLIKGAMRRLAPWNQEAKNTTDNANQHLHNWQERERREARKMLSQMNLDDSSKKRMLHKLSSKTPTKVNLDGTRSFLLHRGMAIEEYNRSKDSILGKPAIKHSDESSWTPNLTISAGFASDAGRDSAHVSAWIHENDIAMMPNQHRNPQNSDSYSYEEEVIVKPSGNTSPLARRDEVAKLTGVDKDDKHTHPGGKILDSPDRMINFRQQNSKSFGGNPIERNKYIMPEFKRNRFKKSSLIKSEDIPDEKPQLKGRKVIPFDATEHHGKKVFVFFNLHNNLWSIRHNGKTIGHTDKIVLDQPEFKVSEAGRQRVIRDKKKNVHAGVSGFVSAEATEHGPQEGRTRASYNPYRGPHFTAAGTDNAIHSADKAHMQTVENTTGQGPKRFGHVYTTNPKNQIKKSTMLGELAASELQKGQNGDWKSEGYQISEPNYTDDREEMRIRAIGPDGKKSVLGPNGHSPIAIGHFFLDHKNKTISPILTQTHKDHQRKGLASAIYAQAEAHTGYKMEEGIGQSNDAKALWSQPKRSFGKSSLLHKSPIIHEQDNDFTFKTLDDNAFNDHWHNMVHEEKMPNGLTYHVYQEKNAPESFIHSFSQGDASLPVSLIAGYVDDKEPYHGFNAHLTATDPDHQGSGYGTSLKQLATKHHGRMVSDATLSPAENRSWEKLKSPDIDVQYGPNIGGNEEVAPEVAARAVEQPHIATYKPKKLAASEFKKSSLLR